MINMNRMSNVRNPYQGHWKRVLTVCSAGLLRSPTIAWVLSNDPYNCNVRAAGASEEYAMIPVDEALIAWADEIVCAGSEHGRTICAEFKSIGDKPVHCLNIPDQFEFRDPKLVAIIHSELVRVSFKGTEDK